MNTKAKRRRKRRKMIARRICCIGVIVAIFVLFLISFNSEVSEQIFVDKTIPEIILRGKEKMTLLAGEPYEEPGFSAIDSGQDLTKRVNVESNLDMTIPGEYEIKYSVTDDYGNYSETSRKIIVEADYTFETDDVDFYIRTLENYVSANGYDLSIGYKNLENGYIYKYNEEKSYYGASTIKPVAALYAYENMNLTNSLKNLIEPMISVSSNDAYVSVVDMIGLKNLRIYGQNLGLANFMTDATNIYYSDTTVENQIIIWQKLWEYFENEENGEELKSYFDNDTYNLLEFNDSINALHKYGDWGEVFHDTGIVESKSPYIIVVLTREGNGNYGKIINDVSEKIYGLNELVKNN